MIKNKWITLEGGKATDWQTDIIFYADNLVTIDQEGWTLQLTIEQLKEIIRLSEE